MAVLDITIYPNPILKQVANPVTSFDGKLDKLINDMAQTMYTEGGVGLAANQVGILQRITVIDISKEASNLQEFINPTIISRSGKASGEEGCLSIPGFREIVERSASITVKAQNRKGEEFEVKAEGLLAVCLQHEIDHLDGILFTDRLSRLKREQFKKWLAKQE